MVLPVGFVGPRKHVSGPVGPGSQFKVVRHGPDEGVLLSVEHSVLEALVALLPGCVPVCTGVGPLLVFP